MAPLRALTKADLVKSTRLKLAALYGLNVTDALLTLYLLGTGRFFEVNVLLSDLTRDNARFLGLKLALPAFLLGFVGLRLGQASEKQMRIGSVLVGLALLLYGLTNLSHLFWLFCHLCA